MCHLFTFALIGFFISVCYFDFLGKITQFNNLPNISSQYEDEDLYDPLEELREYRHVLSPFGVTDLMAFFVSIWLQINNQQNG